MGRRPWWSTCSSGSRYWRLYSVGRSSSGTTSARVIQTSRPATSIDSGSLEGAFIRPRHLSGYPRRPGERRPSLVVSDTSGAEGSRDVVGVIVAFRHALREVPGAEVSRGRRRVPLRPLRRVGGGAQPDGLRTLPVPDADQRRTARDRGAPTPDVGVLPLRRLPLHDPAPGARGLRTGRPGGSGLPAGVPGAADRPTARTDCLGAPIRLAGRPVGEFWVARNSGRPFGEVDEDLAVACGATLARFFRPVGRRRLSGPASPRGHARR